MKWVATLAISLVFISSTVDAASKIGEAAPAWQYLQGTDGKLHSLSDYKDAQVVVGSCRIRCVSRLHGAASAAGRAAHEPS